MNKFLATLSAAGLLTLVVAAPSAAQEQSRFGVLASEWDSATVAVPFVIVPIGGGGQVNGAFVTGERYGVQVGIRAQERFVGPTLPVTRSKQTGVYQASTGFSTGVNATWNYDLHIDLRNAQGVAADLMKRSTIIRARVEKGDLVIKPALYYLDSGIVKFY